MTETSKAETSKTDAPEEIWVEPPYFTLRGKIPNLVWEPNWDNTETAQAFDTVRRDGTKYIRADLVKQSGGSEVIHAMNAEEGGSVIGYMCATDWECEIGAALGGNVIYTSPEDAIENRKCIGGCGLVEVEVRFRRVVREGSEEQNDYQDGYADGLERAAEIVKQKVANRQDRHFATAAIRAEKDKT